MAQSTRFTMYTSPPSTGALSRNEQQVPLPQTDIEGCSSCNVRFERAVGCQ